MSANRKFTTPESEEMLLRLKKINNNIRHIYSENLRNYEKALYIYKYKQSSNIFTHIQAILIALKKKQIPICSENYYHIMYCGNILLTANSMIYYNKQNGIGVTSQNNVSPTFNFKPNTGDCKSNVDAVALHSECNPVQTVEIMALFFLNYLKNLTTYEFRNSYICNLNDYIKYYYTSNFSENISPLLTVYKNLKKIVYIKQYSYGIDSKIFGTVLDNWKTAEYNICEIPSSYIKQGVILSDTEIARFDVNKHDLDVLFGLFVQDVYECATQNITDDLDAPTIVVQVNNSNDIDEPVVEQQNDAPDLSDEEYVYHADSD